MPKYTGEGVASHGTPGTLGVPLLHYSCLSTAVLGNFGLAHFRHVILFANVTSLNSTMMSYEMSQYRMCIGHVTFYYKRASKASVGVLACCSSIHQVQLYHQRPACGWCLPCVGRDVSSMSLGWSLLPLTVIIVLAFFNSTVSPVGTPKYLNETWECCSAPC